MALRTELRAEDISFDLAVEALSLKHRQKASRLRRIRESVVESSHCGTDVEWKCWLLIRDKSHYILISRYLKSGAAVTSRFFMAGGRGHRVYINNHKF